MAISTAEIHLQALKYFAHCWVLAALIQIHEITEDKEDGADHVSL